MLLFSAKFSHHKKNGKITNKQLFLLTSLGNKKKKKNGSWLLQIKPGRQCSERRDVVNNFSRFVGLKQTHHLSHPAVPHLLPQLSPQSRPTVAEMEFFSFFFPCQVALLCKCYICLCVHEICCSVTLMGSLRAERWTFTTQTCSSRFFFFFPHPLLPPPKCVCCVKFHRAAAVGLPGCFGFYSIERLSSCSKQHRESHLPPEGKELQELMEGGKKNISIGRVEIITRCNGNPINSTISCSEVLWNYSPHLFENVFPYGSNRPAGCLHISSMTVQMLSVLSRKETASLHPL